MDQADAPQERNEGSSEMLGWEARSQPLRPVAQRPPAIPWRVFVGAITIQLAIKWALNGLPALTDEALALRWLRALVEHPYRGPLGLALLWLGIRSLVRAAFNQPERS